MQPALIKNLARRLMALALLISPPNSHEWAAAMSAELDYVDGSFKALSWSIGCLGTALKRRCISILSPGLFGTETEGTMSKFAKVSAVALVVASALFLFAPTFQQGLKLTVASWHQSDSAWIAQMQKLGAKAEENHDAQALAFVAMQLNDDWENANDRTQRDKLADEAVQWNADLTWIYYPILSRDRAPYPPDANDARWTARLEAWDPNNACVYAREASFYVPHGVMNLNPQSDRALLANSPHWLRAMDKAFSEPKYDSYISRKTALDLDVSQRYGVNDPARMLPGIAFYPVFEGSNFELYAKDFLLKEGADFEAKGDLARAEQSYSKIAHLGELIQLQGDSDVDSLIGIQLQLIAGPKLQHIYEKTGNASAAKLVAYETALAQRTKADFLRKLSWTRDAEFRPFEAWTVQLSLLAMAMSLALILCSLAYFLARALLKRKITPSPFFSRVGLGGTALLFASAIAMYFSFEPYAAAFRNYLASRNPAYAFEELARFGLLEDLPSEVIDWFLGRTFRVYFWYTVIAAGGAIVVWIVYRHFSRLFRHSAPVQPAA